MVIVCGMRCGRGASASRELPPDKAKRRHEAGDGPLEGGVFGIALDHAAERERTARVVESDGRAVSPRKEVVQFK